MALLVTAGLTFFSCATNPDTDTTTDNSEPIAEDQVMETGDSTTTADTQTAGNLIAVIKTQPNLSRFLRTIEAANLTTMLQGPGTYTIFAPTNDAFAALPAGKLESLLMPENKTELVKLLQYHIVPSVVMSSDLKSVQHIKTAQGGHAKITTESDKLLIDDAQIVTPDLAAANGVIHVVDKVRMPPANKEN